MNRHNDLPRSYDPWRTSAPPDAQLSSTRCDCGCGEMVASGAEIYVTHDGESVAVDHFAEYAYMTLVARKETVE